MAMSLGTIMRKTAVPILLGGAIASMYVLGACARPEPTPTPILLPDLAFNNVNYVEGEWNDQEGKRNYTINTDIANLGDKPSGSFYVSASGLEQKVINNIEAGKTLPLKFDIGLISGKQNIDIILDPENKVNEKDEDNNYHQLTIDVPKPPLFELVCDTCTDEQYKTFYDNALEDYLKVLEVYGLNKEDARIKFIVGQERYSINFFFNDKVGGAVGIGHDDFDRREVKHETAHAINHTLFPTYHSWFDEGMAFCAEDNCDFGERKKYKQLKDDPQGFWDSEKKYYRPYWPESKNAPSHLIGHMFFSGLVEDYGLTLEQNRTALSLLQMKYLETGQEMTKQDIETAYETALDVSLDPLFELLRPGVMLLYSDKYESGIKVKSEF